MELENVLGGLGGALVAAGAAILGVEASADDGGTALALVVPSIVVVIAAYLVVTKVSRHIAVMSAATAGVVIGLLGASAGLFGSDSDSAVWLLFFAIGCVAAYVSPVFFGRHGLLTAALLAMWGVIVTDGLGSAADPFGIPGLDGDLNDSGATGTLALILGLMALVGVVVLDRRGLRGIGTSVAAVAAVSTAFGVVGVLADTGSSAVLAQPVAVGQFWLSAVIALALAAYGGYAGRRGSALTGVIVAAFSLLVVVLDLGTDSSGELNTTIVVIFLLTVGLGLVVGAMRVRAVLPTSPPQ